MALQGKGVQWIRRLPLPFGPPTRRSGLRPEAGSSGLGRGVGLRRLPEPPLQGRLPAEPAVPNQVEEQQRQQHSPQDAADHGSQHHPVPSRHYTRAGQEVGNEQRQVSLAPGHTPIPCAWGSKTSQQGCLLPTVPEPGGH